MLLLRTGCRTDRQEPFVTAPPGCRALCRSGRPEGWNARGSLWSERDGACWGDWSWQLGLTRAGGMGCRPWRAVDREFIQVRHEKSAALMACAHAKLTGLAGYCLAPPGPGALRLLGVLHDTALDRPALRSGVSDAGADV